ncbi:aromatic ring-hydroxylating dioxygenase subunit alpha [Litorimonas sp.]|uniref:aromatic ring-hydroxylating dioxygenase subunit alpha n=1 Tax=Litorimonas sp. TaxID=1892381 RepID=UPI003A867B51
MLKTVPKPTKSSAPVLPDGTSIDDLINLDMQEVQLRVMADKDLYDLEMEKIFSKTWILLGHESEIPNESDFMVREMGTDQVIVTRGKNDEINVLLNVCPHRGMRVCTAEAGNKRIHKCIYHGWAFKNNGDFLGAPVAKEKMHGEMRPKSELGLETANVEVYGGLIFANFDKDGQTFEEYLGDMKWYYDMLFCRTDRGLEALGPPQRFIINANWKTASEQAAADGYHTITLHQWLGEFAGFNEGDIEASMMGVEVTSRTGHAMRCQPVDNKFKMLAAGFADMSLEEKLELLPPPGVTKEMMPQLMKHLDDDQLALLVDQPPQVGGMFPNILVAFIYAPQPDGTILGLTSLHTYVPRGPDKLEFTNWIFAEKDAPQDLKDKIRKVTTGLLGTSGMIEQDDSDTWPHMTRNAKGPRGRNMTLKYQAVNTLPRPKDWPGPAEAYDGFTKDDTQWNWWLRYYDMMTAE